jgi:predicted RNA binding protein YcfA (HicA-like mRNA interferase family)
MGSKYPLLRPTQVIAALSKLGFRFVSQKGSHAKYTNGVRTCIIPMHEYTPRGTLRSILSQAGVTLEEFLKLL